MPNPTTATTPELLALLADPDQARRWVAAGELASRSDLSALPTLEERLVAEPTFEIRAKVAEGIGLLGQGDSCDALVAWIRREREGKPSAAATALSRIGPVGREKALDGLRDPSPDVRYWCAVALARIGDTSSVAELELSLEKEDGRTHTGADVRLAMVKAVNKLRQS